MLLASAHLLKPSFPILLAGSPLTRFRATGHIEIIFLPNRLGRFLIDLGKCHSSIKHDRMAYTLLGTLFASIASWSLAGGSLSVSCIASPALLMLDGPFSILPPTLFTLPFLGSPNDRGRMDRFTPRIGPGGRFFNLPSSTYAGLFASFPFSLLRTSKLRSSASVTECFML